MEEIIMNSQEELYDRIKPALRSKKRLLRQAGFKNISEKDIWDYLRFNKWSLSIGLELCDMVDDILHTDNNLIVSYYHNKYMNIDAKNDGQLGDGDIILPKLKS
ncbi:MAG: post-transcriptional regulator [Candidatus Coprovivens sp.]